MPKLPPQCDDEAEPDVEEVLVPKHDIRMDQSVRDLGKVDTVITVIIDGAKRGELHVSKGGVDWWPRNAKTDVRTKSWTQLAAFLES